MAHRLTVVLDDDELYRQLKVRAALEGAPLKRLIEEALRAYVREAPAPAGKPFDFSFFDDWRKNMRNIEAELGAGPVDGSDVKHQLYGFPPRTLERPAVSRLAEEPAEYDADK